MSDTLWAVLMLVAGLGLLTGGGELLVRGAARLASGLGISTLVIGLTVVAFGTSAPEMAVSLKAAYQGQSDIALGNVVGSNIFNVLFILGVSALILPLVVSQQLIRLDVPIMIGVSVLLWLLCLDGVVGRVDGLILFAGIIAYTIVAIIVGRKEVANAEIKREYDEEYAPPARLAGKTLVVQVALIVAGLALLVLGARWLVEAAIFFARAWGVSELIIGLTIVAAGTSLPEVAASITAALKGHRDIAVGNVVGSNIFNILSILGLSSLVAPITASHEILNFDIPVMTAVAIGCLPVLFTGHSIARWEGAVFLFYYAAYTAYLILAHQQHDILPVFSGIMLLFVVPLTVLTLVIGAVRYARARRAPTPAAA